MMARLAATSPIRIARASTMGDEDAGRGAESERRITTNSGRRWVAVADPLRGPPNGTHLSPRRHRSDRQSRPTTPYFGPRAAGQTLRTETRGFAYTDLAERPRTVRPLRPAGCLT